MQQYHKKYSYRPTPNQVFLGAVSLKFYKLFFAVQSIPALWAKLHLKALVKRYPGVRYQELFVIGNITRLNCVMLKIFSLIIVLLLTYVLPFSIFMNCDGDRCVQWVWVLLFIFCEVLDCIVSYQKYWYIKKSYSAHLLFLMRGRP